MKFLKKYFFLLFIICVNLANDQLWAQIYPVQISAQLVPPYSGYLPDYADPTAEKLKVILQFNDFTQAQYNIKLRFEIKGNGFTISTKTFYNPPPITLLPGQPLLLSGADLAPYLNTNNLDFVGINQSQYQQRMALPEGYYSICIKAYDYYNTNPIQISNEACAQAWFTLSDPPYLNLPFCGTAITPLTPQNILFQWTPVNMASPNSAFNTEYEFELFECRPDSNANPNQVVLSTAPIFSTTTQQTFLNYGIAEPPLNLYMKYIWRVRAKDITGRDLFKNNGYSQICTFTNGTIKNIFGNSLALTLTARAINHRNGECTFTKQSVYSNYMLQVRKQNTNYWFNFPNTSGIERIPNLEPNTVYECRVRGEAGTLIGDWSNTEIFKTSGPPVYSCNDNTQPVNVAQQPLPPSKAVVGLVIQSGQFEVVTTQIQTTGQPGWFKGKGYAIVFGALPVAVQWTNIYIDSEQRQQQGVIEAMTKGINKWLNEWDIKEAEENATYVEGELDSVYVNGNQICYSLQGNSTPICVPTPTGVNVVVIRDSEGNQYNIQLNPPPPKVTGPFNYLNFSDDQLEASDNLKVVFEAEENQNFGFDKKEYAAFIDNYEVIKLANGNLPAGQAGNYFVPNKSIGESANDIVVASYTLTGYTTSQLSFKTKSGISISKIANGNKFKLTGIPSNAVCIYAYADNKKIGKLNIISLKAISKKLVIVPVNNASTNLTASQLNNIYKQVNVSWSITTAPNFTFNLGSDGLEAADATLLSKYSSEMRALRDAYIAKDSAYDKQAYYLFVVPNFTDANLSGYMVRGRALGFIKSGATPKEIAHELAHGAFALEHTFPKVKKESSNNLMDYSSETFFVKEQWLKIGEEIHVWSWKDDEEDGALFGFDLEKYLKEKFGIQCFETYKNYDGIIPQCFWNNNTCNLPISTCYGNAMVCGIIDGVFITVKDVFNIAEFIDCWSPLGVGASNPNCYLIREKTIQTINTIKEVCNSPNGTSQIYSALKNSLGDWATTTFCTDKTCAYNQGRMIFDVVSLFYGVGEVKTVLKTGIAGTKVAQVIVDAEKLIAPYIKSFIKAGNRIVNSSGNYFMYVKIAGQDFTIGSYNKLKKAVNFKVPFTQPSAISVVKAELKDVTYITVEEGKEIIKKGDIDVIEEGGVAKVVDKSPDELAGLFAGARKRAIAKFGKEAEHLIYIKFYKDGGAAAEILDHYGTDGLNALKKVTNIQDAADELINGKIAYRHIGSSATYLNQMKLTGKIPSRSGSDFTYFSLDKIDNPSLAIDKMQLNGATTDAVWRAEFEATQLVNKTQIPHGKWNDADYIEVLTRSYKNFGSGGASQFVTQSEITIKRLVNLKTGEIINF